MLGKSKMILIDVPRVEIVTYETPQMKRETYDISIDINERRGAWWQFWKKDKWVRYTLENATYACRKELN